MFGSSLLQRTHRLTGHNAAIFALSPGFEPGTFLSAAGDGWVVRWQLDDPETGRLLARTEEQIFSLCSLPGERLIVAGTMNGGLHWIPVEDAAATRNIAHHQKGAYALLAAGEWLLSAGGDGALTRWSVKQMRSLETLRLSNQALRCLDYNEARNEVAVGSSDNSIYLLDAGDFSIRRHLAQAHDNSVFTVRYHPDGRHLLSGGRDAHLRIWDLDDDCRCVYAQPAHWFTINDIAFSPDGRLFATASRDKTVKLWDATTFELLKVLDAVRAGGHLNSVNTLLWHEQGPTLISAGDDRSMVLWTSGGDFSRQAKD